MRRRKPSRWSQSRVRRDVFALLLWTGFLTPFAPTGIKKQQKVIKRIPPKIIRDAKGLAIFTSMRTGMAPFGGAGGAGVVVAKLPDGCE